MDSAKSAFGASASPRKVRVREITTERVMLDFFNQLTHTSPSQLCSSSPGVAAVASGQVDFAAQPQGQMSRCKLALGEVRHRVL
jgi:hypothetical protein